MMTDYWEQPIDILSLGAKERGALRSLTVKYLRELKGLDLEKIFMLPGYGRGTYIRLQKIQKKLLKKEVSPDLADTENSKVTFEEIIWMLSARTQHILERLGVNTINDLLGLTDQIIIDCQGAGRTVLSEIIRVQEKLQNDGHCYQSENASNEKVLFTNAIKIISARTRRALGLFGVNNFEELLNITENDIIKTPTLGAGTWLEIKSLQKKYRHLKIQTPIEWLDTPANEYSIKSLPLFSNQRLSLSDIDLHQSYMPYLKLEKISLPEWTTPYIEQLARGTLGELLLVPGSDFLNIQGFGKSELDEIQKVVYNFLMSNLNHKRYYTQSAEIEYLNNFPFFNGIGQPDIDWNEIDKSYYPDQPLNSLNVPVRALNVFKKSGIKIIGELLATTPVNLFKQGNFGVESLDKTRRVISKFILQRPEKIDLLSSSDSLADILIKYAKKVLSKRSLKVISMRLGLLDGQPKTLEGIAQKLCLTRERIRQIQKKANVKLELSTNLIQLEEIRLAIEKTIRGSGGRIHAKKLASEIDKVFNWSIPTSIHLVSFMSNLFKSYEVKGDVLLLPDFPCDYCNHPMEVIISEVPDESEIEHSTLSKKISAHCKDYGCNFFIENELTFSLAFLQNYIEVKPSLAEKYICHNETICPKDEAPVRTVQCRPYSRPIYIASAVPPKPILDATVVEQLTDVLSSHFTNGYRLNSPIEMARFRSFAAEDLGEDLTLAEEELKIYIAACGTTFDGKVYAVSAQAKERIKELAEDYFADGAQAIFFAEFYGKNENWLHESSVVSEDMLVDILRRLFPKLSFTKTYFGHTNASVFAVLEGEIQRVWGDDVLLTYGQLAERLQYIPLERIKNVLGQNGDFIWSSVETFSHVNRIEITDEERLVISEAAMQECNARGYASITDLPFGEIEKRNYELSITAIHNAVYRIFLSDKFDKKGKIVARKGGVFDALTIMKKYCRTIDKCSLDDLLTYEKELTGEVHRWIPMEAGNTVLVRIDKDTYVADRYVHFNADIIDDAIGLFVKGDYLPLKSFTTFGAFPDCGQAWNLFLLESYCRRFSRKFRFDTPSVNSRNAGAVIRKSCGMDYTEIMTDAVANADVPLKDTAVGKFLYESGYMGRSTASKVNEIINKAKAIRERRD